MSKVKHIQQLYYYKNFIFLFFHICIHKAPFLVQNVHGNSIIREKQQTLHFFFPSLYAYIESNFTSIQKSSSVCTIPLLIIGY